MNWTHYKIN